MGVFGNETSMKPPSRTSSRPARSSDPSLRKGSRPSTELTEQVAALQAKLEQLREAGESDRATIQALRDDLAALTRKQEAPALSASDAPTRGRSVREFFGGTI